MNDRSSAVFELDVLGGEYAVCRFEADTPSARLPAPGADLLCCVRTRDEVSVALPAAEVRPGWTANGGWRALRVRGPLDFALTGVLASLLVPLADAGVSVLVLSTYDTDWVLVGGETLPAAVGALRAAGHTVHH